MAQNEIGKKNDTNKTREVERNLHHLISMMRDKHIVGKSFVIKYTNEDEYQFQSEQWKEKKTI